MELGLSIIIGSLFLALIVGIVLVVIEIINSQFIGKDDKYAFLMLIFFLPLIGSIVYLTYGRKRRIDPYESEYV